MADPTIEGLANLLVIGRGGFSTVYRARQAGAGRDIAVKVLHSVLDDNAQGRFERECQILGGLSHHPGICTLYSYGLTDAQHPYLVLELCTGSLAEKVSTDGPLPWRDAQRTLTELAEALQFAHERGVLHRDVKPENVLLSQLGHPVLSDFGIARTDDGWHTTTGMVTASIAHAAPEVLNGDPATVASDVWSLASTGYQLLTGLAPFRHSTSDAPATLITRVFRDAPPDLRPQGVPDHLCTALETAMAKDPTERPPTARAFAESLEVPDHSDSAPISTPPPFALDEQSPDDTTVARPRFTRATSDVTNLESGLVSATGRSTPITPDTEPPGETQSRTIASTSSEGGESAVRRIATIIAAILATLAIGGAVATIQWYGTSTYFVGFDGDQVVIYQGRPEGLLWIDPEVVELTRISRADVPETYIPGLVAGNEQPSLALAQALVANIARDRDELVAATESTTTSSNTPDYTTTSTTSTTTPGSSTTTTLAGTGTATN